MSISIFKYIALLTAVLFILGCKRQEVIRYEVNPQHVSSSSTNKANLKSDLQLITIMYADVFGASLSNEELKGLNQTYLSFGDKDIVIDRITQYFLSQSQAQITTAQAMRANIDQFIIDSYIRFYVRQPNEAEVYYLKKIIEDDGAIQPRDVYYALLTGEEYKYY